MNILELMEKRQSLKDEMTALINAGEAEKRELNDTETARMAEIRKEVADLDEQVRAIEKENEKLSLQEVRKNNAKQIEPKMKLINLINDVVNARSFSEEAQAHIDLAKGEMRKSGLSTKGQIVLRAINATTATEGQENVAEEKTAIELALRNKLVAVKAGATFLGNLVGDVSIPTYSGSNVAWAGETAAAADGQGEFGEVTITPKRLTATLDVSKQFLLQDSNDAEAMLIRDLAGAIAEKLETTIFGDGAGSATQPKGLFNGVTATDSIDAIAYQDVLEVEQALEEKNATEYMFVTSPAVKFALKGVQKGNGLQMVCEGNEIDGIDYVSSNSVLKNGFLALDPKSLVIGQWGGIDILVDPYTKAADGCVRLVVNAYFDAAMKSDRIEAVLFS